MRKAISGSDMNLYVTEKFLQKRYPSNAKAVSVNASNVEISVDENIQTKKFDKSKKKIFGLIGNYKTRYKGLHIAIEAFGQIKDQIGDFEFRILGKGNPEDYKELIKQNNLEKNIVFSGSLPNGDAVLNWLDEIDFYLQPSLQEGLPRATIEAMSRKCICMGSDTGGIPELLKDEFISKAGSSESLVKVILNTLNKS
ncbi:MAG: glycosyltransferase family 4 protein [Campylobacterota bacterium]